LIKASQISSILSCELLQEGHDFWIDNILFDSRKISHPQSSIFVPINTERRNAHRFIQAMYDAGVRCFFVSIQDNYNLADAWIIQVNNTLDACQQMVAWHRAQFTLPVIGITGSNGKTIVKEWLNQLLENNFDIVRSPKSYNSQIGVPLSVWQIQTHHTLGIFEAGISQADEMERLEKMIQPNIGIFTNIGEQHAEGFLNVKHKINEKLNLFKHVKQLIYNCDYEELHECVTLFVSKYPTQLITWSKKMPADLQIVSLLKSKSQSIIQGVYKDEQIEIIIPFTDDAYIEDSIHCWLTALTLGLPHAQIGQSIKKLAPIAMRLEVLKGKNNCTLINDSYSSDISSLNIALDLLLQQNQHKQKIVILSDIYQSGKDDELYEEVLDLLLQKKIDRLIGVGEMFLKHKSIFAAAQKIKSDFFLNTDTLLYYLEEHQIAATSILIKGARKFEFEKISRDLQERIHQTILEINLDALIHNYKVYQNLLKKDTKIMAMVKAFSYGSGSVEVANKLQFQGVDYLAVAYTDEGIALRKNGIHLPIMIMNADEHSYEEVIEYKLEPEIYNFRTLEKFIDLATVHELVAYPIHIKLDTGMHRLGFDEHDLAELIQILKHQISLKIVTVFSHLTGSEEIGLDDFSKEQAKRFTQMSEQLESALGYSFIKHLCNSSGITRHPEMHFDMVRLGLGLYGIDGSKKVSKQLHIVSKLKTVISQIKLVPANETVGYNRKGVLKRDTKIGTVCVGYADGIARRLGNGVGKMMVNNTLVPIVGNVCMDMCMLDITDVSEVNEGDAVEVFGDHITVNHLAEWADTIPYEILTSISQRVKRVYFEE